MSKRRLVFRKFILRSLLADPKLEEDATQFEYEFFLMQKAIGDRICETRDIAKLSQEQAAELLQIPQAHLSRLENGKTMLTLPILLKLSILFQVQPNYWLPSMFQMQKTAFSLGAYGIERKGRGILKEWQSKLKGSYR